MSFVRLLPDYRDAKSSLLAANEYGHYPCSTRNSNDGGWLVPASTSKGGRTRSARNHYISVATITNLRIPKRARKLRAKRVLPNGANMLARNVNPFEVDAGTNQPPPLELHVGHGKSPNSLAASREVFKPL